MGWIYFLSVILNTADIEDNKEDLEEVEDKAKQNMMDIMKNKEDIRMTCQQVL